MKVIYIMADSLRRDHAGVYGKPAWGEIHTPNLTRFASMASVFDNAYIGSFPTVPNRRDTLLGRGDIGLPFNRWKCLEPEETTFLQYLSEKKIPSMLITDTANNVTSVNLFRDCTAWVCNRGQEGDKCWLDADVGLAKPVPPHLLRYQPETWRQILVNRSHRKVETDWFAPHEPWDPPRHYIDMYDPGYKGRVFEAPTYGQRKTMGIADRELKHTRARYAGEVTMVDTWFGRLLNTVERLGILDETAIIFTSDHGTCFDGPGDLGMVQKFHTIGADGMAISAGRPMKEPKQYFPISPNVARVPLIVHLPGARGPRRHGAIVQPWDMTATILDLFGVPCPDNVIGDSVLPLLRRVKRKIRNAAIVGDNNPITGDTHMAQAMAERWCYTVWRGHRPASLYDLSADPLLAKNVIKREPTVATRLHNAIYVFMLDQGLDPEFVAGYKTG